MTALYSERIGRFLLLTKLTNNTFLIMTRFNNGVLEEYICRRYITRNGKRIYPKKGQCFCFWVPVKD